MGKLEKVPGHLKCPHCGKRTTKKMLDEHSACRACTTLMALEAYDRIQVAKLVRREYAIKGRRWDQVLADVKKKFRTPPGVAEWKTYHIVEIDGDRLNWGGR